MQLLLVPPLRLEVLPLTLEIVQATIPALLTLLAAYLTFRMMLQRDAQREAQKQRAEAYTKVLDLRLAAYERATLLLERIDPGNLVPRLQPQQLTAEALADQMIAEINAEFEHNIVQQLYLSEAAWKALNQARADTVQTIHQVRGRLRPSAAGTQLAELLFLQQKEKPDLPIPRALSLLRQDVVGFFATEAE